ncbi:GreA/GreB family elongation factor [Leeuwenhoekiella sp. NPDC079379]|uniref:GreA/GreB family elongation factor n=1 Tax=Leeuwenhoekiella sp. NPDC079379 TaxID=3364122 RepID=UPI0037C9D6F1
MSRGFVKEDDQEEAPIIPPRASLPVGEINYVTKKGLMALKTEKVHLENQILNLSEIDERELRRSKAVIVGKLQLLNERLLSARVLENTESGEVRFGATVSYQIEPNSKLNTITIVGVDEADVKKLKISFTAPIAKALMGKKVGEIAELKLGNETRLLKIKDIRYTN